jgi:hypothetical protein
LLQFANFGEPHVDFLNTLENWGNGLMNKVSEFINNNGGESKKTHNFNRRINWGKDVKKTDKEN